MIAYLRELGVAHLCHRQNLRIGLEGLTENSILRVGGPSATLIQWRVESAHPAETVGSRGDRNGSTQGLEQATVACHTLHSGRSVIGVFLLCAES
jgi:hypothetical protein